MWLSLRNTRLAPARVLAALLALGLSGWAPDVAAQASATPRILLVGDGIIDPDSDEILAAIVYGSDTLDTSDLDASTLAFGPLAASPSLLPEGLYLDLDGDQRQDHITLYRSSEAGFASGDDVACLQYDRQDRIAVQGCGEVTVP